MSQNSIHYLTQKDKLIITELDLSDQIDILKGMLDFFNHLASSENDVGEIVADIASQAANTTDKLILLSEEMYFSIWRIESRKSKK